METGRSKRGSTWNTLRRLSVPALLLCSSAVAKLAPLPALTLNPTPIGRTTVVERAAGVPQPEGPVMTFPPHVRAVLNAPGQNWRARYVGEEPPAYVAVIPLNTLAAHYQEMFRAYPASLPRLNEEINRVVAMAQGAPIRRGGFALTLPYIPLPNMIQVTVGSVARITNTDIQGFRYLTAYSPESGVRIPREAIRYTFQGMTRDGKYLVIMHVPYMAATLPTAEQIQREDARHGGFLAPFPGIPGGLSEEAWQNVNERYLAVLTSKLDAEGYMGRLAALDAVVRSIRIRP